MSAPDLCRAETARAVARRFSLHPRRELSQNFLVDRAVRDAIVAALPAAPGQLVEIGCGLGALSQGLLAAGHRLTGIELDSGCVAALGLLRAEYPEFRVVARDALAVEPAELGLQGPYTVVANLPYQITGAILPRLLDWAPPPRGCHMVVQLEVAERLVAGPGDWSLATLGLRSSAEVELKFEIPPESFWPAPGVSSALIAIRPHPAVDALDRARRERLMALARPVFQQRRKQLPHGLARSLGVTPAQAAALLASVGIAPERRPGTLDMPEWWRLLSRVELGPPPTG